MQTVLSYLGQNKRYWLTPILLWVALPGCGEGAPPGPARAVSTPAVGDSRPPPG